jgi:hypothetical protein
MSLENEYEKPTYFQLTLFQPYLSYLQLPVDNINNNCSFGFADTQMTISTAFVFDMIPFMKTLERMTNPCFQNTDFATLMKGKHVTNAWEDTMLDSVGEVSGSEMESVNDEENNALNAGSDNGSVNDEVIPPNYMAILLYQDTPSNNPLVNLFSQATQVPGRRISVRLQGGTQVEVTLHSSARGGHGERLEWLTFQAKIRTPHLENVQER